MYDVGMNRMLYLSPIRPSLFKRQTLLAKKEHMPSLRSHPLTAFTCQLKTDYLLHHTLSTKIESAIRKPNWLAFQKEVSRAVSAIPPLSIVIESRNIPSYFGLMRL